ncbi:LacI family DNA-binding transcriptional regulator [Pararhodobacter sp.]|uniref:LacI family DNA-binding transcriptional regulator n=1 Tax=Pararhodobacter sp. TaxID=2127056 RepID=UPI002FDE3077
MQRNRTTTIKQIAGKLGVHPSTVSRALNPQTRHLIGDVTRERIERAAKVAGFFPNAVAASLRTGRSKLIGVFLPDISNTVFSPILKGVAEVLTGEGFATIVADLGQTEGTDPSMVFELVSRRVEGVILATVSRNDKLVERCLANGLPVVLVNRAEGQIRASSVTSDDIQGMRMAMDHLCGLGHRRIGHLAGPQTLSTGFLRKRGFREAAEAWSLSPEATPVVECQSYSREAGAVAMKALLDVRRDLTAIAVANDLLALGAYEALGHAGLKVPDDVSVVGHNDMPLIDLVNPPMTTIRINHRDLGREAACLLMNEIKDNAVARRSIILAPELVVRASTRAV